MRIYWVDRLEKGKIGMMPRPKGGDWLPDEIVHLKRLDVSVLVSLITPAEVLELGLEREHELCTANGIQFYQFPIQDLGVPESKIAFNDFLAKLAAHLDKNERIVIHCRMGIGRTSLTTASLLKYKGDTDPHLFDYLSEIRTLAVPDRPEQIKWVME